MNHALFIFFIYSLMKGCGKSLTFNFLSRCLLLFLSCTCASAHTIHCSKLECWCFTHWHPDRLAQLTCLWYARKLLFIYCNNCLFLLWLIFVSWIAYAVEWILVSFYPCSQDGCSLCSSCLIQLSQSHSPWQE